MVQELIEGHELTSEFKPGEKWSETKILSWLQEILAILVVVHRADMIHRDLKPANIMRRQQDGKLVLIDFGAVKRVVYVDSAQKKDSTVAIGAIAYMAPEQAVGRPGKYSDIYALGKLAIQALTGLSSADLPQDSDGFQQLLAKEQISISPGLKTILSTMISFPWRNRYADADEALQALGHKETVSPFPTPDSPDQLSSSPTTIVDSGGLTSSVPKFKLSILLSAIALLIGGIFTWRYFTSVNYAQLETYLQNKQWQQADRESDRLLLKVAGESNALDSESINQFPCKSLQKIDQLWTSNSQGRFGYTPQKKAYLATGNEFNNYTQSSYEAFGDQIGWRIFGVWSLYGDLKFSDIAPIGHLPSPGKVDGDQDELRTRERGRLLSRFDACEL